MNRWLAHTRLFDRKAIRYHYDVNDDFFGLWLDRRRVYSCAYFLRADDTLDEAQERKLDHICAQAHAAARRALPGHRVRLGALVMWAAEHYGVQATGITLSQNQHDYARARIRAAGLEDRCRVQLMDYRDVPESDPYDKIASVGCSSMSAEKTCRYIFGKIQRRSARRLVMNHGITLNATDRTSWAVTSVGSSDDYVFPGGELTHVSRVIAQMSAQGLESAM